MKKNVLIAVALFATMTASAQNIAVVSPNNETKMCQTLDEAITDADNGSIIYLPGGGFKISDDTKIEKSLTIMGVSYRGDTDNADGATAISGSLNFASGSSGSGIVGVFISGDVNIGVDESTVYNISIRRCNIGSIQVKTSTCASTFVDQCYIRELSHFGGSDNKMTNCIASAVIDVNGSEILNSIFLKRVKVSDYREKALYADNSIISNNIIVATCHYNTYYTTPVPNEFVGGTNNTGSDNIVKGGEWGDNCINIGDIDWNDVFEKYNGGEISINSNFHLKGDYEQYDNKIGIYGGSGFNPEALAPIPRIVSKKVDEHTDGSGKLHIEVTVKAN